MNKIDTWNALRMPLEAIGECGFCVHAGLTGKSGTCHECVKTMEERRDRHIEAIGECKFCVNASLTGKTGVCLECIKTMEVRKDRHRIHWEYSGSREEQKVNPD